jgi:RNA polymerase sigma-70 factor (ECF subfamily)
MALSRQSTQLGPLEARWMALIQRIAQGDQQALAPLYDETSRFVYALALRILQDYGLAEEATMDVYLQIWRHAHSYAPARGNPSAWLLNMARSRAIDLLRRKARKKRLEESLEAAGSMVASTHDPEQASLLGEEQRRAREALAQLNPEQREVIEIAYFAGLSHSEIAELLGLPLGTIKTRIRSGMLKLRESLVSLKEWDLAS